LNGSATITLQIKDSGGTANGGADTSATQMFVINVTPVNDAPSFTKGADQTVLEDAGAQTVNPWATSLSSGPANESSQTLSFQITANTNATLFSAGPSVSPSGVLTYTPAPNLNGSATITLQIKDSGGTANGGADTSATQMFVINVTPVNDAPSGLSATPDAQSVPYSDAISSVVISATDIDSAPSTLTATTSWKKSTDASFVTTQPLGGLTLTPTSLTSADPRTWTLSGRAMVAIGTYIVRVSVSDGAASSYTDVTIEVTREDTTIEYTGDTLKSTNSTATNSTTTLDLSAVVREQADGNLGDKLGEQRLTFTVYASNDATLSIPKFTCTVTIVPSATQGTGTAGCTTTQLAADNYLVKIVMVDRVAGVGYYSGSADTGVVTITIAGTGFTTGGGWIMEPTLLSKSNFGFTVKYLKNGNVQGNSLYIYRKTVAANTVVNPAGGFLPAGQYNWIIKSNAMTGLNQTCTTGTPKICNATFTGKANITAVNRTSGVAYSLGGNYQFQVDVTDNGEPGSSPAPAPDRYALRVWDTSTGTYYQLGSATGQIAINGGNIQVRP
jgi:Bacterial Ig domain